MTGDETWIWGRHPVLEALRARSVSRLVIASDRAPAEILVAARSLASESGVPSRELPLAELERLVRSEHTQGIAAQITPPQTVDLADLLNDPERVEAPFLLALDQIQDPHNLGALLRTADAAGVHGILAPDRRTAPLSGSVAKVAAGALGYVKFARVPNLTRALQDIKRAGIWVVGLEGEAGVTLYDIDLTVPLVLVLGNEGSGLRRLTAEQCDHRVRLPMTGRVESLNAAVAGSVAMYEVMRQRHQRTGTL